MGHFYGTEYKILVGFGPVGCTENFGLGHKVHTYATFEGIFLCFNGQKKFEYKFGIGLQTKVSVQGVVALGSHFATLYQEVDFYCIINFKKKRQILLHF